MTLSNWLLVAKEYMLALLCFGLLEFISAYYAHKTISQLMWQLIVEHQWKGVIILSCMAGAWACLIAHLAGVGKK
jgi:branched-subunit amino acid transport protein AzlD